MSAGVSCALHVTFTPQVRQDIFANIKFLTETGPVDVPLRCLIKRCAPRVITKELDFGSMVIGQNSTQLVHINNTQALPTNIVVTRVEPVSAVEDEQQTSNTEDGAAAVRSSSRQVSPRASTAPASSGAELEIEIDDKTTQPAETDVELAARVRRITTEVLRKKQRESPQPLTLASFEGSVPGYGTTALTVVCAPLVVGPIEQDFNVVFTEVKDADKSVNDEGELVTREQRLTVRVKGDKLAIFLNDETVDLRTCLHDRVYRKRLEVRNRAKTAYRVNVKIPSLFKGLVEVSPEMMFVQARSSQFLNVKFAPSADMLNRIGHFCMLKDGFLDAALVSLPIELEVVNQDLPVYFVLRSEVTSSKLQLSSTVLNFGKIYVNQRTSQQLRVKNTSMLPQKIAFVKLKREVSVEPNDGFAVLLPNEEAIFDVYFSPASALSFEMELLLLTSCNDKYRIKILAEGIEAPVEFSSSVIHMRTTGPGERVLESALVKNTTSKTQCLEIMVPDPRFTWLKISPTIVELAAGQSARIEFEYLPPDGLQSMDPVQWHEGLVQMLSSESQTLSQTQSSPLEEWREENGWVFARGMYGELQWVKAGAGIPPAPAPVSVEPLKKARRGVAGVESVGSDGEGVPETKDGDGGGIEGEEYGGGEDGEGDDADDRNAADVPKDLPQDEWGVAGRWRVPVCLRQRAQSAGSATAAVRRSSGGGGALGDDAVSAAGAPMWLVVETMVTMPQLEADPKILDFGQLAVGTRELRSVKLINRTSQPIKLAYDGINAVGPFAMIRPPRVLAPGEMRSIVVECLPVQPGLTVDILTLKAADSVGGHQLRVPLRAQGLKPTIELQGLAPPPFNWNARCGLLDLGGLVPLDRIVKTFTIVNKSAFAVDVNVFRAAGRGLSPAARADLVERSASGVPIISFKPEHVNIPQGASTEITVTFEPDRGRFMPFREDLEVVVGQTDEILKVGIVGRCWARQCYVIPANPVDEPFHQVMLPGGSGVAPVEDILRSHPVPMVRQAAIEAAEKSRVGMPPLPPLTLEFPDPFAAGADPTSYNEVGAGGAPAAAAAKGAKGAPSASSALPGARSQIKKILVGCAKVEDGRTGSGNATFEVLLSQRAKDSGLWQLSTDKGSVNVGQEVPVEVVCTLNKPLGVGGLAVGSWETYQAEVVVKGGWAAAGDGQETRVTLMLRCFVSL